MAPQEMAPPPPAPGYPAPAVPAYPTAPAYAAPAPAPENGMGIAALVLGIVGIVFLCGYGVGIIPSILAIVFGKIGMNKADQGLADNRSLAKTGFILGIIGVVLAVLVIIFLILVVIGVAIAPTTTGTRT